MPKDAFHDFARKRLTQDSSWYAELKSKHLLYDAASAVALDLLAAKYRTQMSGLKRFTGLHIFVVTLRCDHSAPTVRCRGCPRTGGPST